ncbi:MAG: pentose-5-phosphate 3-epimerase, partial [Longicatena sp.]
MKHIKIAAGLDRYFDYGYVEKQVKEAVAAGCDLIHSDAIDMESMKRAQLIGGHNVIIGINNA